VGPVYKSLLWLFFGVAIVYGFVYGIMKWNDARIEKVNQVVEHMPKSRSEQLPPEPRLQLAPGHAMHPLDEGVIYRDSVANVLTTYAYLNKQTGAVRIPIERAKEVLLQHGLAIRMDARRTIP